MKNGKSRKPLAPGDGQIKNWTNQEGVEREANKGKTTRRGEWCEAAKR